MRRVTAFGNADVSEIVLQDRQSYARNFITPEYAEWLAAGDAAWTLRIDQVVIATWGIVTAENLGGRVLWCFLADTAKEHLIAAHRIGQRFVDEHYSPFLLATVECGFHPGERWLRMLGFEYAQMLEHYGPDGQDHSLFMRKKP